MPSSEPLIQIENLRLRVPDSERLLLDGMSFQIEKGEFVLIHGDSASGKSWLVRILAGLTAPSEGRVRIAGQELGVLGAKQLACHRRSIGIVSTFAPLLDDRDLWSNVVLPLEIDGALDGPGRHRAELLLRKLGIFEVRHSKPRNVSMSERQRALFARALVREPLLLILDDPTIALNDDHASEFAHLLFEENLRGMTVVLVTGDARLTALLPLARQISLDASLPSAAAGIAL